MCKNASVWDDEELYRSIRSHLNAEEYIYYNGKLRIRSNAFRDIGKKPSVDRAKLREYTPFLSRLSETDGIVSLIVEDIRKIIDVETKTENRSIRHIIDVIYEPNPKSSPDNYAHSQVVVDPEYFGTGSKIKKTFSKLQKALARIATIRGWTLPPKTD